MTLHQHNYYISLHALVYRIFVSARILRVLYCKSFKAHQLFHSYNHHMAAWPNVAIIWLSFKAFVVCFIS